MSAKRRAGDRRAEQPGGSRIWLPAVPVVLLTVTTLLPTDTIGADSLCLVVLMWLLGCGGWLYVRLKQGTGIVASRGDLWWCVAAVFIAIGAWFTAGQGDARSGLNASFTWCIYPVTFFMIRDVFRDDVARKTLAAWMIALAVGLATHAVYQFFIGMPATRARFYALPEDERVAQLNVLGIDSEAGSPLLRQFYNRLRSSEPYATFSLANSLAGFLVCWSLVALPVFVHSIFGSAKRSRVILLLAAAMVALCIVLTKSRASWLALALGGALMSWRIGPKGWKPWILPISLAGLASLVMIVGVLLGAIDKQVFTESVLSLSYRLQYWQSAVAMIQDHWLFGVGAGNFQGHYAQYKLAAASEQVADPHQFFLEIWATIGIVPLLLLMRNLIQRLAGSWRAMLGVDARLTSSDQSPSDQNSGGQSTNPAQVIPPVLAAGVFGCLFAVIFGLPFEHSLELLPGDENSIPFPVVWAVVLPAAAITFTCLQGWIATGAWHRWWCLLGVLALLINLSAAGGISFPGVACSMWCLLALSDVEQVRSGSKRSLSIVLLAMVLFAGVFIVTSLRPILERNRHMLEYGNAQSAREATTSLNRAIHADPRAPAPARLLAQMTLRRWVDLREEGEDRFREALDQMVATNPRSQPTRVSVGRMSLTAYTVTNSQSWIDRAIFELETSARLNPNYAMSHARLAWAYHLAGRAGEASCAADAALKLDPMHKHEEHKLRQLQVEHLADPPWVSPPQGRTNAEQTMERLRKTSRE